MRGGDNKNTGLCGETVEVHGRRRLQEILMDDVTMKSIGGFRRCRFIIYYLVAIIRRSMGGGDSNIVSFLQPGSP